METNIFTFNGLLETRSLTGILRIVDHHLANLQDSMRDDISVLVDAGKLYEIQEVLYNFLRNAGYLIEVRSRMSKVLIKVANRDGFNLVGYRLSEDGKNELIDFICVDTSDNIVNVSSFHTDKYGVDHLLKIQDMLTPFMIQAPTKITYITGFGSDGAPISSTRIISPEKFSPMDCFYPAFDKPIHEIFKDFLESNDNLMMLSGEPGTGKTTLLRELIRYVGNDRITFQFCGDNVYDHPAFGPFLASLPDRSLVMLEDTDRFIMPREGGNSNMSLLLNEIDGIASKNTKFLISSNITRDNQIDSALLRGGRCFSFNRFRALTGTEAKNVLSNLSMNLPERIASIINDNPDTPVVTLAEVLTGGGARIHRTGF